MARTETYEIQVERPKGVSVSDMRKYIQEAVEQWSKGGDADDPKWNIKVVWVTKVTSLRVMLGSSNTVHKINITKEMFDVYKHKAK